MSLLPVDDALEIILKAAPAPYRTEAVPLERAAGRTLAEALSAARTQPPADVSAMDGYAVAPGDQEPGTTLALIGESAAGAGFSGKVVRGTAVRIFTGAPIPEGAGCVVMQEDVSRSDDRITIVRPSSSRNIRAAGGDFSKGDVLLEPGTRLSARHIALAAAAGFPELSVWQKPRIAILMTGDELVPPGCEPGPGQIVAANGYGIAAMAQDAGASIIANQIVPDDMAALREALVTARNAADLVVTIGGASVGDRDLVRPALEAEGFSLALHKIAMRPGKPLMFGRDRDTLLLGLPGNPVSALVTGLVFLVPLIAFMAGYCRRPLVLPRQTTLPLPANSDRRHYMRAVLGEDGTVTPLGDQDSSLLTVLARAGALIIREPGAPGICAGSPVETLIFDPSQL